MSRVVYKAVRTKHTGPGCSHYLSYIKTKKNTGMLEYTLDLATRAQTGTMGLFCFESLEEAHKWILKHSFQSSLDRARILEGNSDGQSFKPHKVLRFTNSTPTLPRNTMSHGIVDLSLDKSYAEYTAVVKTEHFINVEEFTPYKVYTLSKAEAVFDPEIEKVVEELPKVFVAGDLLKIIDLETGASDLGEDTDGDKFSHDLLVVNSPDGSLSLIDLETGFYWIIETASVTEMTRADLDRYYGEVDGWRWEYQGSLTKTWRRDDHNMQTHRLQIVPYSPLVEGDYE